MENQQQQPQQQHQIQTDNFSIAPVPGLASGSEEQGVVAHNDRMDKLVVIQRQALEGRA